MEHLFFSSEDVLERVDEYTLYCSYLGYEPAIGGTYISPIRFTESEVDPSFGIYVRKLGHGPHEFMWKDQGLGIHGDIFDLVQRLCGLNGRRSAMQQVLVDAGLIPGTDSKVVIKPGEKKYQAYADIQIIPSSLNWKDINYWGRINIDKEILSEYNVQPFKMYWLYEGQSTPRYPKGLAYAYQIWDKYQLYFPNEAKKNKFRTNWTELCVPVKTSW